MAGPPVVSVPVPLPVWVSKPAAGVVTAGSLVQLTLLVPVGRKRWVPKRTSNGASVFAGAQQPTM